MLGCTQSRIQHPVYRQFLQASLVGRNATLLFPARQLEERELVHEVSEQRRRNGLPGELGFHVCATLDDPTMGQLIIQTITMIRRLYDVPSYVYGLLPDLATCSQQQKKDAWRCLVSINNAINDYPDIQLLTHCFLYHDPTQQSLAHFLYDITQEGEALDLVERYGYLNKLRREKTSETVNQAEFPAIFSTFSVAGMSYPENEIRHYLHISYLNALLALSRPAGNTISMEQCNVHVEALLGGLPLSEELADLTGDTFLDMGKTAATPWQKAEDYWQQAVERIVADLQDKPRDEWVGQLRSLLENDYQTRYRQQGVEYFYQHEKKKTSNYCLVMLCRLKEGLQQALLHATCPPETCQDIVRSVVNRLQVLALHFSRQRTELNKTIEQEASRLKELTHRWERFGFFDRMRGKDKALFEEYRSLVTRHFIDRTSHQGAMFASKLLDELIPQVSALASTSEHLTHVCQEALDTTRQYLDDNPPSAMSSTFPLQPVADAVSAIGLDSPELRRSYDAVLARLLYGDNPPLHADDLLRRLHDELDVDIDSYLHQRIADGTLPPVLGTSIVDRIASLYGEAQGGLGSFVEKLKHEAAVSLRLKENGGHKEQYLLIAPECGGRLGPQIVGSDDSSVEAIHILTGIRLPSLDGFAGQHMFVEPSIF